MSELGTVGVEYINRRTGKTGKFVSQDDTRKVVCLEADDGDFTVPFATFKSAWRVLTINELGNTELPKVVEEEAVKPVDVVKPSVDINELSDAGKIAEAKAYIKDRRDAQIIGTDAMLQIYIEGILVFNSVVCADGYHIRMMPDIYTYSALTENDFSNVSVKAGTSDYLAVALVSKLKMGDILQMIKESVAEINLYGYKE